MVAALAMQFLQPRLAEITGRPSKVTEALHDHHFANALKQARRLLEMAAAMDVPDVHAYQLFEPNMDPLSFEAIAKKLKATGWSGPCTENTLKNYAFEIIEAAQEEIEKRLDKIDTIFDGHLGFNESGESTERIRRFLSKMIRATRLNRILVDPENVIESCVHCLIDGAETKVNCGVASNSELKADFWAYNRFVKYVCDGLNYGQFMAGDTRPQSNHRISSLESAIYMIDQGVSDKIVPEWKAPDVPKLRDLCAWLRQKKTITKSAKEHLENSLMYLEALPPEPDNAQIEAGKASALLKLDLARWKLKSLEKILPASQHKTLLAHLQKSRESGGFDPAQLEILKSFANPPLLDLTIPPPDPRQNPERFDYAQYLTAVQGALDGARKWLEKPNPGPEEEKLIELLKKAAATVADEISTQATRAAGNSRRLYRLLDEISGDRPNLKVRPYELFLFAHQQGILREELTVKPSKLNPGVLPGQEWPYQFSILSEHGGVTPSSDPG